MLSDDEVFGLLLAMRRQIDDLIDATIARLRIGELPGAQVAPRVAVGTEADVVRPAAKPRK